MRPLWMAAVSSVIFYLCVVSTSANFLVSPAARILADLLMHSDQRLAVQEQQQQGLVQAPAEEPYYPYYQEPAYQYPPQQNYMNQYPDHGNFVQHPGTFAQHTGHFVHQSPPQYNLPHQNYVIQSPYQGNYIEKPLPQLPSALGQSRKAYYSKINPSLLFYLFPEFMDRFQ